MENEFQISKKRVLEVGMCLLVFLLPWQTRWIISAGEINGVASEYLTISLFAIDIALSLLLLLKIFHARKKSAPPTSFWSAGTMAAKFLFLFVAWNGLSIFWAANKLLALQHFAWLLLAMGLAWLISEYRKKTELVFWFLTGLLLSAWLGIWQFFSQIAHANKWLGLSGHDPMQAGTSIVEFYTNSAAVRWLRSYGSFDHPNIFGVMMAIGIVLSLWLFAAKENKKTEKLFLFFSLLSFAIGLFASLSRSAWLGLFFGLLVIIIKSFVQKMHKDVLKVSKPFLLVVFVFMMMAFSYQAQFMMRSGGAGRLEQRSISDRVVFFQQGKNIIAQNWLLGVGSGNYIETLKAEDQTKPEWTFQPVHNVLVFIWAELGIVSFLLGLLLLIFGLCMAWQKTQFELGLIVVVAPSLMVDHWFWSLHFGMILMGFLLGFVLNNPNSKKQDSL